MTVSSSPSPQVNISRPPFPVLVSFPSPLIILSLPEPSSAKIIYKAFLSYSQLKEFLTVLTANDLLSYGLVTQSFKTTEKGLRFLKICNQIDDMMKALQ